MEGKDDDDSDDSDDFRPKGETNADQADERVAKIKKERGRVDAQTPAAANQSGFASDDNWERNFDQTPNWQLERQMTLPPEQAPKMPAATNWRPPKPPTNQQQVSATPPATPWHADRPGRRLLRSGHQTSDSRLL